MKNKPTGANWIKTEAEDRRTQAQKALQKAKSQRKGRYQMVKVCDFPLTYKEVKING